MVTSYTHFKGRYYDGETTLEHQVDGVFGDVEILLTSPTLTSAVRWPYAKLREVSDQAGLDGIALRARDEQGRLIVHGQHSASIVRARSKSLGGKDVTGDTVKRVAIWGAGAIASVVMILFVIIPALANQLAQVIPVDREIALGRSSIKQIERFLAFGGDSKDLRCTNAAGVQALEKMTARLSDQFDSPYPLNVQVFNHKMVNAFAVPGGQVVLFDGLLQKAGNPEEVAGVLGHELGHVINRDPTRLTLRSAGSVGILGMVFGDFAGGAVALVIAEQLIAANYAQDAESKADLFAHEVLEKAGLPSKPFGDFFDKLREEHGDNDGLLSHIASHPALSERADAARGADTVGDAEYQPVLSDADWKALLQICDSVDED